MRVIWFMLAAAVGTVFLVLALFAPSATVAIPIFLAIAFLVGLSLGLGHSRVGLASGLALSAAPGLLTAVKISWDLSRDPTSHNLWPFALFGAAGLGLIPAAGLLAGYIVRKLISVPPGAAWIAAYLAVVLAILSPLLSRALAVSGESDATSTLKRLWQAETTYAAADPKHRFTCEGPLLRGFEHELWFAWTQLGLTAKDHMGHGRYWFTIHCGALSRGDRFYIVADPYPTGGDRYCIDESGMIHSNPAMNGVDCGS